MKAIVQEGYGAPERVLKLEDIERPSVGDDDVLIRVRATSVNTPDWVTTAGVPYVTRLAYGLRRPKTPVRGTDVAGVVEAVGKNVTDLQPGDEVFGSLWDNDLNIHPHGTFAEYSVLPVSQLIKKPVTLSFEDAAGSVMSGLTALIAIRDVGGVGSGTRVLINGASGRLWYRSPREPHSEVPFSRTLGTGRYRSDWVICVEATDLSTEIAACEQGDTSTPGTLLTVTGTTMRLVNVADRYRARGPPTCLKFTLTMLGFSASFQSKYDQAEQFFDDSARVDVPDRSRSRNKPVAARAALRRGNRSRICQILRSYIDELLDKDNMFNARLACVEFINMMVKIDRLGQPGTRSFAVFLLMTDD